MYRLKFVGYVVLSDELLIFMIRVCEYKCRRFLNKNVTFASALHIYMYTVFVLNNSRAMSIILRGHKSSP